jgi:hypothetical protein
MGTRRYASLGWSDGTNGAYAVYDLQSGVVGSSAAFGTGVLNSASIQALPNGWYRCVLSAKHPGTTGYYTQQGATAATITADSFGRQTYLGTGATLFMGHVQLETGTVATSPIPTLASLVTRAPDQVSVTPASINYSGTAGSWWVDVNLGAVAPGHSWLIGVATGGSAPIYMPGSSTTFSLWNDSGGSVSKTVPTIIGSHKVACAFAVNDEAITADGLAAATGTGATTSLLSPGTIYFGNLTGGGQINGYIRQLRYVPRRKTSGEMQTETT